MGYFIACAIIVFLGLVGVVLTIVITTQRGEKAFRKPYNERYQALMNARAKHDYNVSYLNGIGFHTDRHNTIGDKYYTFDHTKRLTAFEELHIDDRFLTLTRKSGKQIDGISLSHCSDLIVFPFDKIVECMLLQDGAVIKSSEGSAVLAGTSVPMLGLLQGKASSSSNEHQTGILSVRLTLDDMQVPSVIFHFTGGGVDKSSTAYAQAFQQAQEVFGIFDAIVRMNLKEVAAVAPKATPAAAPIVQAAQPTAASAPSQTANESGVFEKIRQLGKLRDEGLLTEEEFAQKKKLLIEQIH